MPAPTEAARPTRKVFHGIAGRERGGEHRRQRRDRTVHQADKAGLDDLQDEAPALALVLVVAGAVGQELLFEVQRLHVVLFLDLREIAEQLADRGVGRSRHRLPVEARRRALHFVRARANDVDMERTDLPDRLLRDVAMDVLAAHERDVLAKLRDEKVDELAAVFVLLAGHFVEHFGAGRVVLEQTVGEVGVDAAVLLLVADGEGQHFALG